MNGRYNFIFCYQWHGTVITYGSDQWTHNSSNHKIHSYGQIGQMIVNLINKKCKNNNKSTGHLNQIQISLLMSIFDTPEKYVSNVDRQSYKRKMHTLLIKSSSTLFSCSIRAIYNRVHRAQNQCLMLKSFIPAINKSIFPKNIMKISFLKTHQWITCLDWKSPSCNTFPQRKRLIIHQN